MAPIVYTLPLCEFERQQLTDLQRLLDQSHIKPYQVSDSSAVLAFDKWKLSSKIRGYFADFFSAETLLEEYQDDKGKAYEGVLHWLAHDETLEQNLARTEMFRNANADFVAQIDDLGTNDIEVKPALTDSAAWQTIGMIYAECGLRWFRKTLLDPKGTFELWRLIRIFSLQWKWPKNKGLVYDSVIQDDIFKRFFNVRALVPEVPGDECSVPQSDLESLERLEITKRKSPQAVVKWDPAKPECDEDGNVTDAYLGFLLREIGADKPLEDPRAYLHMIDWSDLKSTDAKCLKASGVNPEVPFLTGGPIVGWVLWKPPYAGYVWNHHLRTEDEVYEYNITKNWPFPDHYCSEDVVFAVRPVRDTHFFEDLKQYWDIWNDCALTLNTDGQLLILETIPGLRFRSRVQRQDKEAAMTYFRNLVEAHASKTTDNVSMEEIFGSKTYSPLYEHSLRVITETQLRDVDWDKPLGEGQNGAVYSATWQRQPGHLSTSRPESPSTAVVLKDIKPRAGSSQDTSKKLLRELDLTYASLGGSAVGCVDFLGIAVFRNRPQAHSEETQSRPKISNKPKICLVFERANQATVLPFLSNEFRCLDFMEAWEMAVSSLDSIANGLHSLHKHGVLHRDLHLNNILVTKRYYPNDPTNPYEYDFLLTDIGEGKILDPKREIHDSTAHVASYGAKDFRAPEIRGSQNWSTEAEVFSFGVIMCKVLDRRRLDCQSAVPDRVIAEVGKLCASVDHDVELHGQIVPSDLMEIGKGCLSHLPSERPSIGDVIRVLDDLSMHIGTDRTASGGEKKKVVWTIWNWNEDLARGRRGLQQRADEADDLEDI